MSEQPGGSYPRTPAYGEGRPTPTPTPTADAAPGQAGGTWLALGLSLAFNLFTLGGVLGFGWPPGNVFLLFWIENAVLGVATLLKVATARAPSTGRLEVNDRPVQGTPARYAVFFTLHYGLFCLVHLVFTLIVAVRVGIVASFVFLGLPVILVVIRYSVETATSWFGDRGLRERTQPERAMFSAYPRVVVLHLSVLLAFGLVLSEGFGGLDLTGLGGRLAPLVEQLPDELRTPGVAVVAILVLVKTVVDLVTTRRALRVR